MDFSKLKWDASKEGIYKRSPELKTAIDKYLKNSTISLTTDVVARYIVLVYAQKSPFTEREDNLIKRKKDVCGYLKLSLEEEAVQKLVGNKYLEVCKGVLGFLQLEESPEWTALMVNLEIANDMQVNLLNNTDGDEKKRGETLIKLNQVIFPEIARLKAIIFSKDAELSNKVEAYLQEEERRAVYPEDFV